MCVWLVTLPCSLILKDTINIMIIIFFCCSFSGCCWKEAYARARHYTAWSGKREVCWSYMEMEEWVCSVKNGYFLLEQTSWVLLMHVSATQIPLLNSWACQSLYVQCIGTVGQFIWVLRQYTPSNAWQADSKECFFFQELLNNV